MVQRRHGDDGVISQVKNQELVRIRRRQIVDAAVRLFIDKGFHRTPTRQIADSAGFSIGSLYEYVSSKDDVLFLVCDAIHDEIERGIQKTIDDEEEGLFCLASSIDAYIRVCDTMADHLKLIYQETKSLPKKWRRHVLEKEVCITGNFVGLIQRGVTLGELVPMDDIDVDLLAHNIMVVGHMWAFRRWFLKDRYTLDSFIQFQTRLILTGFVHETHRSTWPRIPSGQIFNPLGEDNEDP